MVAPALDHIPSTDTRAILKRSVFIVFAKDCIYYRPPSQDVRPVMRVKWFLKDILVDECKPRRIWGGDLLTMCVFLFSLLL